MPLCHLFYIVFNFCSPDVNGIRNRNLGIFWSVLDASIEGYGGGRRIRTLDRALHPITV